MTKPAINKLSDEQLEIEVFAAQRRVRAALAERAGLTNRTTDAGLIALDEAVYDAERQQAELIAERDRRRASGTYQPAKTGTLKEVVAKPHMPQVPKPAPPRTPVADDGPEELPIKVYDNGFYRTWKKGDPRF